VTLTKLAIFDLDDTLLATRDAVLVARDCVLREFLGLETPLSLMAAQDVWQRLTWYYSVDDRLGIFSALCHSMRLSAPDPPTCDLIGKRYAEVFASSLKLTSGAENVLDRLKSDGKLIGLVTTGKSGFQKEKIALTQLERWIPSTLTLIEEPGSPSAKPRPTSILNLCSSINVKPSDVLAVGDRITDVIAGNLAGCRTVLYYGRSLEVRLPGPNGIIDLEIPDYSIRRLSDLLQFLD
jgi:phosphoglycolate phosphatase-like HAD superfamily hydrolase